MVDEEKIENDISEDEREEQESIDDIEKGDDTKKTTDDVKEDIREENESIDDLKQALKDALYENSILKAELGKAKKERDDAHNAFLNGGKEIEKQKTYSSMVGDLK